MNDFELFGPWTGNALHVPPAPPSLTRQRRARLRWAAIVILSLALIGLGLHILANTSWRPFS